MPWKSKEAERAYHLRWVKENREAYNAYQREWHRKHKDRLNAAARERHKQNPEARRAADKRFYWRHREHLLAKGKASWNNDKRMHENCRLRRKYGITMEEFDRLVAIQRGVCACCGRPERALGRTGKPKPLSVDHNHTTNTVRGLLCSYCNVGIGHFGDDASILRQAADYLERGVQCHSEA